MKERIRQIIEWANLSQQDFANRLGISPASLSSIFTGRTNPTNNHVQAIHKAFPNININWLLFGEGKMMEAGLVGGSASGGSGADGLSEDIEFGVLPGSESMSGNFAADEVAVADGSADYLAGGTRRENYGGRPTGFHIVDTAKKIDKKPRKIKEIRVFFDDGTYEAFVPSGSK